MARKLLAFAPASRRVTRGSERINLTPTQFSLLHPLAKRQAEVLSPSFIASQVWNMNFDSDTTVVDIAIRPLRSKINNPFRKKLVHTVRGTNHVLEDRQ